MNEENESPLHYYLHFMKRPCRYVIHCLRAQHAINTKPRKQSFAFDRDTLLYAATFFI